MLVSPPPVAPQEPKPSLRKEAREWQARAREFADQVVRPVGQVLDRLDADRVTARGSPLYDFLAQAQREGFTRLTDPPSGGGLGLSHAIEYLVLEEFATADPGLSAVLVASPQPYRWVAAAGSDATVAELSRPWFAQERLGWSGCCATRGRVQASRDRDGWVLVGSTSAWVTGAASATHALIACAVDDGVRYRHGFAVVPLDRAGVVRGSAVELLGLRTQARARLVLDGVHISAEELLRGPVGAHRAMAHIATAIMAVGVGRAAYEGSLRLVREHIEERGSRQEQHDAQRRLLRMFTRLEAARSLTRAVHLYTTGRLDAGADCATQNAAGAQAFAAEAALEIVDAAMEICGTRADVTGGVEYPDGSMFHPEKLLRDAQTFKVARPIGARPAPLAAAHH
jgi:alkylation response protein AidB-like acyl-CoA dehydrogenase